MSTSILIVDDETELCDLISSLLEMRGYTSKVAYNAKEALALALEQKFKLVVSDVRMPDMDGVQMMLEMKKQIKNPPCFFIMTGYCDYTKEQILASGAMGVYSKPQDMEKLIGDIHLFMTNPNNFEQS